MFINWRHTYPFDQVMLVSRPRVVDDSPTGDHLEKHDSKAVDVGFGGQLSGGGVFGRTIAIGSHDPAGNLGAAADGAELGEAEIGELGVEIAVEKNVGGLEVSVDDGRIGRFVQVLQPSRGSMGDLHPSIPIKRPFTRFHILIERSSSNIYSY